MLGKMDKLDKILIVGLYKEYGVGDKTAPVEDKEQIAKTLEVEDEVSSVLGDAPKEKVVSDPPTIDIKVKGKENLDVKVHDQVKKPELPKPTKKKGKKE